MRAFRFVAAVGIDFKAGASIDEIAKRVDGDPGDIEDCLRIALTPGFATVAKRLGITPKPRTDESDEGEA